MAQRTRRGAQRWGIVQRPGALHTLLAVGLAASTAAVVAGAAPTALVLLLVAVGMAAFVIAAVVGAPTMAGLAGAPVLGAALLAWRSAEVEWIGSIVVGCLWYGAVELAWHAIERRGCDQRARAVDLRRAGEVLTVIGTAIGVSLGAYGLAFAAPVRTLGVQAAIVVGFLAALVAVVRALGRAA